MFYLFGCASETLNPRCNQNCIGALDFPGFVKLSLMCPCYQSVHLRAQVFFPFVETRDVFPREENSFPAVLFQIKAEPRKFRSLLDFPFSLSLSATCQKDQYFTQKKCIKGGSQIPQMKETPRLKELLHKYIK